jgi:hypothetical protein
MKRTHSTKEQGVGDDDTDRHPHVARLSRNSRPAKVIRVDMTDHNDVTETECRYPDHAPIDVLTDDILYHLFNGSCADGTPIFPPECRWVPALVCRRWHAVVGSITRADIQAASGGWRGALWDAPPSEKVHHHSAARASGMALMI